MGAFDVPFGVLPFDHTRVGTRAASPVEALAEFSSGVDPDQVRLVRGKNRAAVRPSVERCVELW